MSDDDIYERPALVLDNGTHAQKCGLSGQDAPTVTFRTCVGYPKHRGSAKEYYVGEEAMQKRGELILKYPVEHGIVQNWDDMEKVWRHAIDNEMRIEMRDKAEADVAGVLISEPPPGPKENRERVIQIWFETFHAPRFHCTPAANLALYASGRTTGLVVDCGHGVSHTIPIYEGYSMPHAIQRINLAGCDLDDYMCKLLSKSNTHLLTSREQQSAVDIKEQLCYLADDFEEELRLWRHPCTFQMALHPRVGAASPANRLSRHVVGKICRYILPGAPGVRSGGPREFEMPDRQVLTIETQLCRCPELMFKPSLDGKEMMGLHQLTAKTVYDCDFDVRQPLLSNIVMSGGTTMFPNMPERLQAELQGLFHEAFEVKVIAPPERAISVWMGGSILASLSTFDRMWINRTSDPDANPPVVGYEEIGPRIVHQMCNS